MIVEVTEESIEAYGLVEHTGRSKDELLALAQMAREAKRTYRVIIPDKPFNVFEEFETEKSPVVEHGDGSLTVNGMRWGGRKEAVETIRVIDPDEGLS